MLITRQGRLVIIILVAAGCRSANVNAQPAAEAYSYTEYVVHDSESPRDCRRLQLVRGWSHDDRTQAVFT